jgi:hypothetical protein
MKGLWSSLPEDVVQHLLENWLTLEDFIRFDTAACNKHVRDSLFAVISKGHFTISLESCSDLYRVVNFEQLSKYLHKWSLFPRHLSLANSNISLNANFSRIESLTCKNVVEDFLQCQSFVGDQIFAVVTSLKAFQDTPWYPESEDDFFDMKAFLLLVMKQFPFLQEMKLALGNNVYQMNPFEGYNGIMTLQKFHLSQFCTSSRSLESLIIFLSNLPHLSTLSLVPMESICLADWQRIRNSLQLDTTIQFRSLQHCRATCDVASVLVNLCPFLQHLDLVYYVTIDEELVGNIQRYWYEECPGLTLQSFSIEIDDQYLIERISIPSFRLTNILKNVSILDSLSLFCSGATVCPVELDSWALSLDAPVYSMRALSFSSNVFCTAESTHEFVDSISIRFPLLENIILKGNFNSRISFSSLKSLEGLQYLKHLELGKLDIGVDAGSISLESRDFLSVNLNLRNFHQLKVIRFVDIGTNLDDEFWHCSLPEMSHLVEWSWIESIEICCITSKLGYLLTEMCPNIQIFIAHGIWKEIDSSMVHHIAMVSRQIRKFSVAASSTFVREWKKFRSFNSQRYFIEPEVLPHSFHCKSIM